MTCREDTFPRHERGGHPRYRESRHRVLFWERRCGADETVYENVTSVTKGDVVEIKINGTLWRIGIMVKGEAIMLYHAETGELLEENVLEHVGIEHDREPGHKLTTREKELILHAYVIAWILLHPTH